MINQHFHKLSLFMFIDNNYTSNKKNIANGFNKFYSTIGMKTQQSVANCNKHFSDYLNNPNVNSIFY